MSKANLKTTTNRPLIAATREEVSVDLNVKSGTIPTDWYGHNYVASFVGSVNSGGLPFPPGNQESGSAVMNGDGYVLRFDLGRGKVHMKTALMKTPCFYADLATKRDNSNGYDHWYNFNNWGICRMSLELGCRNFLNTAITPFQFTTDRVPRMTACYDVGRPWEMDADTLGLVTPIGTNPEWVGATPEVAFPFAVHMGTAHPSFDPVTKEYFVVNYNKSLSTIIDTATLAELFKHDVKDVEAAFDRVLAPLEPLSDTGPVLTEIEKQLTLFAPDALEHLALKWLKGVVQQRQAHLQASSSGDVNEVFLFRWDGKTSPLNKWKVVDETGTSLTIIQCMHQTSLTQDYIILADATFKFTLDLMFNVPFSSPKLDDWLRRLLTDAQLPYLDIYLVKRSDLDPAKNTVIARKLQRPIPLEAIHFSADYSNPNGKITLHLAHNSAACLAEWARRFDTLAPEGRAAIDPEVVGLPSTGTMDIGRIGKVVIDAQNAAIDSIQELYQEGNVRDPAHIGAHTWGVGLYTYRDIISPSRAVDEIRHIYWSCYGLDPRLLTNFIYHLYFNYPERKVDQAEMLKWSEAGIPFVLSRQNTATMALEDHYQFDMSVILKSLQFVPRQASASPRPIDPQMDGFIFTTTLVNYPNSQGNNYQCEIWIFDAAELSKGPICVLNHPKLDYAFTLHSAWIESAVSTKPVYQVNIRDDYDPIIAQLEPEFRREPIQGLFENFVYPNFATSAHTPAKVIKPKSWFAQILDFIWWLIESAWKKIFGK